MVMRLKHRLEPGGRSSAGPSHMWPLLFVTEPRGRCGSRQTAAVPATIPALIDRHDPDPKPLRATNSAGGSRPQWRFRAIAPALLFGGACLLSLPGAGFADPSTDDLKELRASLQKEIAALRKQEQKLHQEFLKLDQKSQLLDQQLRNLRATGVGTGGVARSAAPETAFSKAAPGIDVAQTPAPAGPPETGGGAPASPAPPAGGEAAPISGPSAQEQRTRQVVETAPTLSAAGGVLTPKGQFVIDPSFEFDYWSQNQLGVNGFQIIPGITFGNIFVTRFEQNISTAAVTVRGGVTDRLELNAKIPFVYNTGSTSSLIPVGASAELLTANATGTGIGDLQFGGSYQINSGENGWPIFVGNLLFKTVTGISPFEVPIITLNDPNGQFLSGTPKSLATGTGFYSVEPSLTVLLPTAPGVLFANLLFIHNLSRTQKIQSTQGGPPIPVNLAPGDAPALTFGIGFSLNDRTAMTLSYQQEHVFAAFANNQEIKGSPYSFGTFNFGLGYQISQSTRLNLSVGIGAGPNTPVAKVLFELPYKFSL